MYALYLKTRAANRCRYVIQEQTSLFGSRSGWIPRLFLKHYRDRSVSQPLEWRIPVGSLIDIERPGHILVINLKPRDTKGSIYEIEQVWGRSADNWTPIMLHLRGLLVDENPNEFDELNFERDESDVTDPIFSIMYLNGTVIQNQLSGRWTPPGPSSTNSVLLWPETLRYFCGEAQRVRAAREPANVR